jgi:hypothetical protein
MGYFAHVNSDHIVQQVISISNNVLGEPTLSFPDTDAAGRAYIANTLCLEGEYRQTSYNGNFRGKYAAIGDIYDTELDEFVSPAAPEPTPEEE